MEVKLTNNPMAFESINCPRLNKPYIGLSDFEVPTNIRFNSVYYWNNNETRELTAFKVLGFAILNKSISYLLQFPDKREWIDDFFKYQERNIFPDKDSFFTNAAYGDRYFQQETKNIARIFSKYCYAAVVGFKNYTYVWRNSCPCAPCDANIEYFLISASGASACISQKDANGYRVYLTKEDCIKNALNNMKIKDFAEDAEPFRIEMPEVKAESHTIRVIEF